MQLPESKIELAASKEDNRYTLKAVKLDVEQKRMLATDGHILAVVPVKVTPEDHSALLSPDTIKNIRTMQKRSKSIPVQVAINGKAVVTAPGERAEYELMTGTYPNCDLVTPKFEGPCTICFNVELLLRLAQAIGEATIVKLWIKDSLSPILVKSNNPEAYGVIMPCRP